jgi:hypothetical protein
MTLNPLLVDERFLNGDQRNRATVNGIWEVGMGFQLSGVYFFGSGERRGTTWGGDLRNTGGANFGILTPAGTTAQSIAANLTPDALERIGGSVKGQVFNGQFLVDRAQLVGDAIHRVDMRIQRKFALAKHANVDGILEVFNLFNHANYGSYVTAESNARYGTPSSNTNVAYQPRMMQLGFRATF